MFCHNVSDESIPENFGGDIMQIKYFILFYFYRKIKLLVKVIKIVKLIHFN